jgi:hypothetical protein
MSAAARAVGRSNRVRHVEHDTRLDLTVRGPAAILRDDGRIFVLAADARAWGIALEGAIVHMQGAEYIALDRVPDLRARFDEPRLDPWEAALRDYD